MADILLATSSNTFYWDKLILIKISLKCVPMGPIENTVSLARVMAYPLQWRHNEHGSVSNHQRFHCCFRLRSKKTSKLRVTGLCAGNSPVTGDFPAQKASNAENVSIRWRHHVACKKVTVDVYTPSLSEIKSIITRFDYVSPKMYILYTLGYICLKVIRSPNVLYMYYHISYD